MKTIKRLNNGLRITLSKMQFMAFCDSIEYVIGTEFSSRPSVIAIHNVEWTLNGLILTNFFKKLSEKRMFPEQENKIKLSYPEALVIWNLAFNYEMINFPGDGVMLELNKQLLNSL